MKPFPTQDGLTLSWRCLPSAPGGPTRCALSAGDQIHGLLIKSGSNDHRAALATAETSWLIQRQQTEPLRYAMRQDGAWQAQLTCRIDPDGLSIRAVDGQAWQVVDLGPACQVICGDSVLASLRVQHVSACSGSLCVLHGTVALLQDGLLGLLWFLALVGALPQMPALRMPLPRFISSVV